MSSRKPHRKKPARLKNKIKHHINSFNIHEEAPGGKAYAVLSSFLSVTLKQGQNNETQWIISTSEPLRDLNICTWCRRTIKEKRKNRETLQYRIAVVSLSLKSRV